jgi:adenylate cyclase
VLAHCVSEVRQAIGDLDQAIIKTIPRRGYRFTAPVLRVAASTSAGFDSGARLQSPLLERPSVAVLPFANLSGDPQHDYFSDGIAEDITTELSRFSELLVIARNSAFQYKGKAVDIRQVGRELGARYVLEGSIRRSTDRVRIAAQLIDAATGTHRWAERYDRELHEAFAIQDEVVRAIVTTLAAHVNRAETERALLKPPAAWEAYEYYLRGAEAFFLHVTRRTKASLYDSRRLLEQSLAIDPNYARAAAMPSNWLRRRCTSTRACRKLALSLHPFDGDYLSPAALDRGTVLLFKRQHDAAILEFERAFALNPNFIDFRYAQALVYVGDPARAIEVLEAIIRLDPFPPSPTFGNMGFANYMLKRYRDAVHWCNEHISRQPIAQWSHVNLACAYAQLGQLEEARAAAAEVLRINPGFTIESAKRIDPYKDPKDLEHYVDGMRKVGLPES